eukprot:51525-Eustigmatos_ZCMA.PRE.1
MCKHLVCTHNCRFAGPKVCRRSALAEALRVIEVALRGMALLGMKDQVVLQTQPRVLDECSAATAVTG